MTNYYFSCFVSKYNIFVCVLFSGFLCRSIISRHVFHSDCICTMNMHIKMLVFSVFLTEDVTVWLSYFHFCIKVQMRLTKYNCCIHNKWMQQETSKAWLWQRPADNHVAFLLSKRIFGCENWNVNISFSETPNPISVTFHRLTLCWSFHYNQNNL